MIRQPFELIRPFEKEIDIVFTQKEDEVFTDDAAKKIIGASKLASLKQIHGSRVIRVHDETLRTEEADGVMTDASGLGLEMRIADCQCFVVYAPDDHVIGLIHAGWRGLESGIIPSFFAMLEEEFGITADATYVGATPSLCKKCAEFTDPKIELPHAPPGVIEGKHADLQLWADIQLEHAGVRSDHRERMSGCTRCDPKKYWTYRGGDHDDVKNGKTNMLLVQLR